MNENWQSWAALAVVILTAAIFLYKTFRPKRRKGCGSTGASCGCHVAPKEKPKG